MTDQWEEQKTLERKESKDIRYLGLAKSIGAWSQCLSRKVGAVIVRDDAILSTGYNGPPRRVTHFNELPITTLVQNKIMDEDEFIARMKEHQPDKIREDTDGIVMVDLSYMEECPRYTLGFESGERLDLCPCAHAEQNAIAQAARDGTGIKGAMMYMYFPLGGPPCNFCAYNIINSGIVRVVVMSGREDSSIIDGRWTLPMFEEAGIEYLEYPPEVLED